MLIVVNRIIIVVFVPGCLQALNMIQVHLWQIRIVVLHAANVEKAMLASGNQVLMQTATSMVKDVSGNSSISVRIILDSGSQRTYITEKLAERLNLKLKSPEKLSIVTFGTNRPKYIECRPSKLQLILKDGSSIFWMSVLFQI